MIVASLAQDLAPQGIRTVAMSPGWARTDMGGPRASLSARESVHGIKSSLAELPESATGVFLNYQGNRLAW
jgi:NAD(P)-dependent dehydrogenase (short-subunit alcohol dehydrogenase family)